MSIIEEPTSSTPTMTITTIYGKAGSGKTTKLVQMITQAHNYAVLAPTNASTENIYNMMVQAMSIKPPKRDKFKTIYSFFRIDYENNTLLGAVYYPKTLFIDEFGLMNKHLFKKCLKAAEAGGVENVILSGDVVQLNPIYTDKQYISFNKLKRITETYRTITNRPNAVLFPSVVEHYHLSLFGCKRIQSGVLVSMGANKRADELTKQTLNAVYSANMSYPFKFVEFYQLPDLIINQHYTFIASKYKILQTVFDSLYENCLKSVEGLIIIHQPKISSKAAFQRLYLTPGMNVITCQTVKGEYINGQELIFTGNEEDAQGLKCITTDTHETVYVHKAFDNFNNPYYPLTPSNILTVHKSQGRTIDRVIVCIDDMFDISMLYTAITRARHDLLFYTVKPVSQRVSALIESAHIDEFKQLNMLVNDVKRHNVSVDQ